MSPPHLRQGRRRPPGRLPGRRRRLEAAAGQARVCHRDAARWAPTACRCARPTTRAPAAGRSAGGSWPCRRPQRARRSGGCWYPQHLDSTRPPDAVGLADRASHTTAAHRGARGRHLRHRRVPDHLRRAEADPHELAGEHARPSRRRSVTSTSPGRTTGPTPTSSRTARWARCTTATPTSAGSTSGS